MWRYFLNRIVNVKDGRNGNPGSQRKHGLEYWQEKDSKPGVVEIMKHADNMQNLTNKLNDITTEIKMNT